MLIKDIKRIEDGVFYISEKTCLHNHAPLFRSSTMICVYCERDRSKRQKAKLRSKMTPKEKEKVAEYMAIYSKNHNKKISTVMIRRERDRETYRKRKKHFNAKGKAYRLANPEKIAFYASMSRRGKKCATPPWLTSNHHNEIMQFYILARDCFVTSGQPYDVDHIVPLKGKSVCGLHVPWNLQILPRDINMSKKNRTDHIKGDISWN